MLPLTGITVVHLGGIGPGPFAAMILADMGARVIRVVRPGNPADIVPHGVLYRGQETLEANLKDPADVARVLDLITEAQLLIEGFRPGVAERLGLGPSDAASRNPALVYGRMTGWGQDGPLAHTAGHDINYIAISGALGAIAAPDGRPVPPLNFMGDFGGGSMYLVSGLLAALVRAQATGEGAVVDANIVDGAASLTAMLHAFKNAGQWGPTGTNVLDGGAPFYTVYKTSDRKWMSVGAIEPQFYAELLRLLGLTEELTSTEQTTSPSGHALPSASPRSSPRRPKPNGLRSSEAPMRASPKSSPLTTYSTIPIWPPAAPTAPRATGGSPRPRHGFLPWLKTREGGAFPPESAAVKRRTAYYLKSREVRKLLAIDGAAADEGVVHGAPEGHGNSQAEGRGDDVTSGGGTGIASRSRAGCGSIRRPSEGNWSSDSAAGGQSNGGSSSDNAAGELRGHNISLG
ncbi:CaiB/BaiF CoA transferase family protein [Corynebacterium phoceense]|uniref:CaiB/BaiF CoA transferase family protein n=1 Tax=Corynebacterium phoceense TaxID=1686286 RepID=UPI003F9E3AD2